MVETLKNYINGKFVASKSKEFFEARNPATDEVLALAPKSTPEEVNAAIAAAKAAFPKWRDTPGIQRIQPFLKLQQLIKDHMDELSESVVINHGKEWDAAYGEAVRAYQMCEAALAVPEMQKGEYMETIATGIDEYSIRYPLGVFAMIPPFNFPLMIPFWFFPWAIAAGNTYVIKPNEQTPLAMQRTFKLIDQAGFPPGVINMINGGADVATALIDHPDVKGISSVGSTPIAKTIYRRATDHCKRAQCHGGAHNFLVMMPDANVDNALPNLYNSIFGNAGQRCLAGKVVVTVGEPKFHEHFKTKFVEGAKKLKVGFGMDKTVFLGPVVSKKSLDKLCGDVKKGLEEGATMVLDGRGVQVENYPKGFFLGPTILENAKPGMHVWEEEIFGPIVLLHHCTTLDEAIGLINRDPRGNAVTIYTESGENARHFRQKVECGNIGINIGVVAPMAWFPFAGAKDSFFGDLRAQGFEALKFFTQEKVIIERFHGGTKIEWD